MLNTGRIKVRYRKLVGQLWWSVTCPDHGEIASDLMSRDFAIHLAHMHCQYSHIIIQY